MKITTFKDKKCLRCGGEGIYCYFNEEGLHQVDECSRCKGTGYEDPTDRPNIADEYFKWQEDEIMKEYENKNN